jgi:hypothetical protein
MTSILLRTPLWSLHQQSHLTLLPTALRPIFRQDAESVTDNLAQTVQKTTSWQNYGLLALATVKNVLDLLGRYVHRYTREKDLFSLLK